MHTLYRESKRTLDKVQEILKEFEKKLDGIQAGKTKDVMEV